MPVISVRVLGPAEVTVDGVPAPAELLWRKHLALLIHLLRAPRRTRSRDHLVGLLWADRPEHAARHSLNEALRVLRRAGGEGAVESVNDHVRLGDACTIDCDDFERAVAREDWARAAALCDGEFAEGLSVPGAVEFDQWLEEERAHFRALSVRALSMRAEQLLDEGRHAEALDMGRRALALDRLAERAVMAVVHGRLMTGDVRGALESAEAYLARCAEVGVPPSDRVTALIARELPSGPGARTWALREPDRPLVGREPEVALVRGTFERSCRGRRAALIVVDGEPGLGVSRLLDELAARARLDGATVARVGGVAADAEVRWAGLLGLAAGGLLAAPGIAAAPPAAVGAFAARLVPWRERFPAACDEGLSPSEALGEVVAAVAEEAPLLLVLDEAHRLDRASLEAVPRLLRRWAEVPVVVAVGSSGAADHAELDELRRAAGRDVPGAGVRLGPLSVRAIRVLATTMLPSYGEAELDRLVRRIVTDSAGIPLLVVELLTAVSRGLELHGTAKAWPATERTLEDSLPGDLPEGVVAALRINYRQLTPPAQEALAAASVLEEPIVPERLAWVLDRDADATQLALDELEARRWLAADGRGYAFAARLVRGVIRDEMLTPGQRRRLEQRAARRAEGAPGG